MHKSRHSRPAFFQQLVNQVPEFHGSYDAHMAANGELLDHLLLGDLVRALEGSVTQTTIGGVQPLSSVGFTDALSVLEKALESSDPEIQELVAVSFVENLDFDGPTLEPIWNGMGPLLRAKALQYRPDIKHRLAG